MRNKQMEINTRKIAWKITHFSWFRELAPPIE